MAKSGKKRKKKPKIGKAPETEAFGITILGAKHPLVTELLEERPPEFHGDRFWTSTWLLLDYLDRIRIPARTRVLEAGCGWGIASAYCAKVRRAKVTALDADPNVLPIAELQAKANGVEIETTTGRFENLPVDLVKRTDLIVAADVCFWDELVDPLMRMIRRAMRHGVKRIALADPGRPCFEDLAALCDEEFRSILIDTSTRKPTKADGYVLVVEERR